uniref:DNA-directed DNA polymerase n=1 Tax=Heterorhabditis bacteriophora TaxID=37862 RepID=A0A1I7WVN5_HETBA
MYQYVKHSENSKSIDELKKMSRDEVRQELFDMNNKLRAMILKAREVQKMRKREMIDFIALITKMKVEEMRQFILKYSTNDTEDKDNNISKKTAYRNMSDKNILPNIFHTIETNGHPFYNTLVRKNLTSFLKKKENLVLNDIFKDCDIKIMFHLECKKMITVTNEVSNYEYSSFDFDVTSEIQILHSGENRNTFFQNIVQILINKIVGNHEDIENGVISKFVKLVMIQSKYSSASTSQKSEGFGQVYDEYSEYLVINETNHSEAARNLVYQERSKFPDEREIKSIDNIHHYLDTTYQRDNKAIKFNIMFGYVTERNNEVKLFKPGRNEYFFNKPVLMKNAEDLRSIKQKITQESITMHLSKSRPDSKTIILGVYGMGVKITRYDYLVVFDFEAIQSKIEEEINEEVKDDKKLNYISKHTPVSVSITSNVPEFENEKFILSENPRELIKQMFEYFDKVSEEAGDLMTKKMKPLLDKLEDVGDIKNHELVEKYCSVVPIIGFNSGGYDINLAADEGFMSEIIERCKDPFIIKEGANRYKVIKTKNFIFLDQMGYCAAGTTLEGLFKAYDVGEEKGWFPYEWFDSYEKYHEKDKTQITGVHYDQDKKEWYYDKEEVDVEVPEDKWDYFGELSPIFVNKEYDESVCGEYTNKVIKSLNRKPSKSKKLVTTLKAEKILIKSTRLRWMLEHGCIVTKLHGVIEAKRGRIFKDFMNWVSDERRKGDVDQKYAIISEGAKLVGNSAFGVTGMDKNKHRKVKMCNEIQFNRAKNDYFYYDAEEYDGTYEVVKQSEKTKEDRQLLGMDTDSNYMALSGDFESLIKPHLREEFEKNKYKPDFKAFDKRTPGLFKVEFEGDGMIALNSKTYLFGMSMKIKMSAKGVTKG